MRRGRFGGLVIALCELNIFRDVHENGTRAPRGCDMEGFVYYARQAVGLFHEPVVLCARACDPDRVCLLKGVGPDHESRNLAGQNNNWDGIHQSIRQSGHCVGGAGS